MSAFVSGLEAVPATGQCQPHAQLGTPEGAAMLAEAEVAYGPGSVPEGGGAAADQGQAVGLLAVVIVAIVVVIGLAAFLALRRDRVKAA